MNLDPFKRWLESVRRSPHTIRAYLGDVQLAAPALDNPQKLVELWHGAGHKPKTISRRLGSVKAYWLYMRQTGQSVLDPFKDFEYSPSKSIRLKAIPSHTQIVSMFSDVPERLQSAALAVEVMYWTTLRSAEYLSLKGSDINPTGQQKVIGKGDKERIVIMPKHLVQRLSQISGPLYPKSYGSLWREIKELGQLKGLKVHPHLIRHAAITQLLESGMGEMAVADLAGHESLNTTRGYYHPSAQHLQNEVLSKHPMGRA